MTIQEELENLRSRELGIQATLWHLHEQMETAKRMLEEVRGLKRGAELKEQAMKEKTNKDASATENKKSG